jgi:hypothetical protein
MTRGSFLGLADKRSGLSAVDDMDPEFSPESFALLTKRGAAADERRSPSLLCKVKRGAERCPLSVMHDQHRAMIGERDAPAFIAMVDVKLYGLLFMAVPDWRRLNSCRN